MVAPVTAIADDAGGKAFNHGVATRGAFLRSGEGAQVALKEKNALRACKIGARFTLRLLLEVLLSLLVATSRSRR